METLLTNWPIAVLAAVMMLLDIISGFAGAAKVKSIDSTKMRDGLWHKGGFCGLIVLAFVCEVATSIYDAAAIDAGTSIPEIPAVGIVCLLIIAIEIVSVVENLCVLNPQIANLPFVRALKTDDPASPDVTIGIVDETSNSDNERRQI